MAATPQQPPQSIRPGDWSQSDAVALRTFIAENPKFLRVLARRRPPILGDTMESRAVTGSDVKGFLDCIDAIEELQQDPQAQSEDAGYIR